MVSVGFDEAQLDNKLDSPRLYNCWFTKASLGQFHAIMQKLGIITFDEDSNLRAVWPNVWDDIGPFLDPESGELDGKGNRINMTPIQKNGEDAHFVNILTSVDLLPYLKELAAGDPELAEVVAKTDDFFFVATREEAEASDGKIVEGDLMPDPDVKRVIL